MSSDVSIAGAAARAAIVSGPLYLVLLLLFALQESVPAPLGLGFADLTSLILPAILFTLASLVVGSALSFPVCAVAASALYLIADHVPLARPVVVWLSVGAALAVAILHLRSGGLDNSVSYAFIGTALACAAIVRSHLCWE